MNNKLLKISEAAKEFGLYPDSLREWERQGLITPVRTPGGHRRYHEDDVKNLLANSSRVPHCTVKKSPKPNENSKGINAFKRELMALCSKHNVWIERIAVISLEDK